MLRLADADAVAGLQRYCQVTFSGVCELTDASSDAQTDREVADDSNSPVMHRAGQGRHQFDWISGLTLQVL